MEEKNSGNQCDLGGGANVGALSNETTFVPFCKEKYHLI